MVYDQLRMTSDVEPSDPKLGGDMQTVDKRLILSNIVRGRKMKSDHIPHTHAKEGDEDNPCSSSALHQ
jgi:hypothetical protein